MERLRDVSRYNDEYYYYATVIVLMSVTSISIDIYQIRSTEKGSSITSSFVTHHPVKPESPHNSGKLSDLEAMTD